MNRQIKRELVEKFISDMFSVKVWAMFLSSLFLVKGYLTGTNYVAIMTSILSLRSFDGYSFKQTVSKVEDTVKQVTGE